MAALKEIKSLFGNNETSLNRSWVKPTCQRWISVCENADLCSCPLAWREDVTSVPTEIPSCKMLSALACSSPLLAGIGCCAEITSLLLWQTTGFFGCLCLLSQCPNGYWYKDTSVAVLMASTSSPRVSAYKMISLPLFKLESSSWAAREESAWEIHCSAGAKTSPEHLQAYWAFQNAKTFFFSQKAKYHLFL